MSNVAISLSVLFVFVLEFSPAVNITFDASVTTLPTSCAGLEDGYHWIRPIDGSDTDGGEYPNIYVNCVGGWSILDPSLIPLSSLHHPKAYFSSYSDITDYVASSSLNDHVTWREWFIVAHENTEFRRSPDCNSCTESDHNNEVYYMTGNYIGCLWVSKGSCDMDPDSMECYTCSVQGISVDDIGEPLSGLCTHMETVADRQVNSQHTECTGTEYNSEPSIGTASKFCQCYRHPDASLDFVPAATWHNDWESDDDSDSDQTIDTIVEVYSSDFDFGSYRITKPGTYIVMEDILFDMNPGSYQNPNAEDAWYPRADQQDEYEGADGSFIGPYSMGFFAGFAVESDDVIIDLNGFTLEMTDAFLLQQRWFSIIELSSKAFISGQGPGNFGPYLTTPSNVVIKGPGTLGKSSHHAIHGNSINHVTIRDLDIKHFEVAGIAINGFIDLTIENVNIGPIYQNVPVLGVYTQARLLLPRLRVNEMQTHTAKHKLTIAGVPRKITDVRQELQSQMDIMFDHYINGVEYADMSNQKQVEKARILFENVSKLPSASTAYGIFLNSYGASVFAISGSPGYSDTAVLKNVNIFGLYKEPWEVPRIILTKGPFNDIMDMTRVSDDGLVGDDSVYIGSAYTDAQYIIHKTTNNWGVLGHSVLNSRIDKWVGTGCTMPGTYKLRCNGDIMLHVTKGLFGLRVDNVNNIQIDNLHVYDLQNIGDYGSTLCGSYQSTDDGGHRNQNFPLQRGYTGTEVHAISFVASSGTLKNVQVDNIVSAHGDAFAIQFFPSNTFTLENIQIENIHAGADVSEGEIDTENYLPNKVPRACAIDVWSYTSEDDGFTENSITLDANVNAKCLTTYWPCSHSIYDSEFDVDMIQECDDPELKNSNVFETFVAPQSEVHQKLLAILRGHKHELKKRDAERTFLAKNRWWAFLSITTAFLLVMVWKLVIKPNFVISHKHITGTEYEGLLDSDRNSIELKQQESYSI